MNSGEMVKKRFVVKKSRLSGNFFLVDTYTKEWLGKSSLFKANIQAIADKKNNIWAAQARAK